MESFDRISMTSTLTEKTEKTDSDEPWYVVDLLHKSIFSSSVAVISSRYVALIHTDQSLMLSQHSNKGTGI